MRTTTAPLLLKQNAMGYCKIEAESLAPKKSIHPINYRVTDLPPAPTAPRT